MNIRKGQTNTDHCFTLGRELEEIPLEYSVNKKLFTKNKERI
ncbi:MAG: hypothetical protein PF518_09940 [Spirochaetaceae bacterium]|nr:hypothetical protein [Spirochaetaceae bacterium]